MSNKRMSRDQQKAMFAKMNKQADRHYSTIKTQEKQRIYRRDLIKKVGGATGAAIGSEIAGSLGVVPGKKIGEHLTEKVYDEIDPPKKIKIH